MTIHLLPGIGGTSDLFLDYQFPFPVRRLDFIRPPSLDTSFADYARLMAFHHRIEAGDTIVGMSLGGLLACEISKQVSLSKLILVSSGTQRHHIAASLRSLAFAAPFVPFQFMQSVIPPTGLLGPVRRRALEMFKASDPNFINWGCIHAPTWSGLDHHPDLTQIHGTWDPVFPYALQRHKIHHPISRGGHIAIMRQYQPINDLLIDLLSPLFSVSNKVSVL